MNTQTISRVIVYHDETGEPRLHLKGHALLFIPYDLTIMVETSLYGSLEHPNTNCKQQIYGKIMELRKKHDALGHKFHFTDISGAKWGGYNPAERSMVDIGVDALRRKETRKFDLPLCCKLAIIYYPDKINFKLYRGSRREKILKDNETLLRFVLKGAVHLLYDANNRVEILKIITDGNPYHRKISEERVLHRLLTSEHSVTSPLRPYVKIPANTEIVHQSSNHRKYALDSEEYLNSNMLQLVDMLLGSAIHSCYVKAVVSSTTPPIGCKVKDKKGIIASPVREMLDKKKERGTGFTHSGHYQSFSLSEAFLRNEEWDFREMLTKEDSDHTDINQLRFL